jgi:uncharacterized protein (TIGR02001 family)
MKYLAKPLSASIAATVLAAAAFAPAANAELSASAGVASMYLWRGVELGDGTPAVFGDLIYSVGGAYIGIWGSSGDSSAGSEYDLFAGYGGEVGAFSYDISIWNYNYSDGGSYQGVVANGGTEVEISKAIARDDTFKELTEIILTLGFGPVTFQYYDNIAGATGYEYYTLAGSIDKFTLKAGYHDPKDGSDMTHIDFTYAYNDRLSFTVSKVVDEGIDGSYDDDAKFVVAYSLPIDL